MNALAYLLSATLLCVLGGGCATYNVTERVIEINDVQTNGESPAQAWISPLLATNLFHDVLGRLGSAGYIASTHESRNPANPVWVEYDCQFTQKSAFSFYLTLETDGKHISFRGITGLDKEGLAALQKAVKLYREALDERQIKYKVRTHITYNNLIKS